MGASGRLITSDVVRGPSAPAVIARDGDFDSQSDKRDLRPNRVVTVTTDAAGADTFTLTFRVDPDPDGTFKGTVDTDGIFTTAAINDDDNAATIQAAIRAALPGTDLTVVTGDGPGPFLIIFDREFYPRRFPRVTGTGTGCTVTISDADPGISHDAMQVTNRLGNIGALGESKSVTALDSIIKPTIGTITVTGGTDEVRTVAFSAGTDGGSVEYQLKGRTVALLDYNATASEVETAMAEGLRFDEVDDVPTVAVTAGREVATLDLDDIGAADTYKLTYNSVTTAGTYAGVVAGVNTYGATDTTDIQAMVDELTLGTVQEGAVVARVDQNTYTITSPRPTTPFASTFTATSPSGFTPLGSGGYTAGGKITTAAGDATYTFTFENGSLAGRPYGRNLLGAGTALTDGGVAESPTETETTPGVLGSISAAYTENGSGDSVLAAAVNDATGDSVGFVVDAATPVVITGVPVGASHLVLRTVEDGRVSKADSKAFTMTSS